MRYVIGVDLGTSGTKTVLFDEKGTVIASMTIEYPMYQPKNGYAEHYQSIQALHLKNGAIYSNSLGRMSIVATDGVVKEEYFKSDQLITSEEYEAIIPSFQAELEGFTANMGWFTPEDSIDEAALAKSWEYFRSSRN